MYCNEILFGGLIIAGIILGVYTVLQWFADECERQCAKRRHPPTR